MHIDRKLSASRIMKRENYRQNWFKRRRRDFDDMYDLLARCLESTRCRIGIVDIVEETTRRRHSDIPESLVEFEALLNAHLRCQFAFNNTLFAIISRWETCEIWSNLTDEDVSFSSIFANLTFFLNFCFVVDAFKQLFNATIATLKLTSIVPDDVK